MPFIHRDSEGQITGLSEREQSKEQEYAQEDRLDVVEFVRKRNEVPQELIERGVILQEVKSHAFTEAVKRLKARGKTFQHH